LHGFVTSPVNVYSATSTNGGTHSLADCNEDAALAWEEGHASYFGCAIRRWAGFNHPNLYLRPDGGAGAGHLVTWFDTETESQFSCSGDTSEVSVFTALWDITDTATTLDFTPTQDDTPVDTLALADTEVWQVMTALPGSTFITAEDFWDKWFATPISNGNFAAMKSIF